MHMKILHIHTKMVAGGIEAMVCSLANEMSKSDNVTVCTIFKPSAEDVFYKKLNNLIKKETIGKLGYGFSIKEPFKVWRFIKEGKYNIVHIHGCFQYYALAVLLLHNKTKFIYTIHSDAKKENQKWDRRLLWFKRYCFRKGWIKVVTISKTSQLSFNELYSCASFMIPNGIPVPQKVDFSQNTIIQNYRSSSKTRLMLHPGRISMAKNQLVLCKAITNIINEGYDVKLLLAGAPENYNIFCTIKPYFNDKIIYLGEINNVVEVLSQVDGMCMPSLWEGLPVSLLESLSVGCVPICSPVGGMKDVIIDGFNGILSESSSEEDYTVALRRFMMLSDEELLKLKRQAEISFSNYTIEKTVQSYLEIYKR